MSINRKAQTTVVMIVIVMAIFAGIITLLLTLASTVSQVEYMNLYSHNMLLATLRTDTGYLDSRCQTISDTLACAFLEPSWVCSGSGMTCKDLAESLMSSYSGQLETVKKNYLYLFTVEPEGFTVRDPETGEPMVISVGNLGADYRGDVIAASERIVKGGNIFKAQLKLARAPGQQSG